MNILFQQNINLRNVGPIIASSSSEVFLECKPNAQNKGWSPINNSDVNICVDFVGKFSACLWRQGTRKIFKFTFWSDLDI